MSGGRDDHMPDSWTLSLNGPGMTAMHRAGLGGLAATLLALAPQDAPDGSAWDVSETRISLESRAGLGQLLEWIIERGLAIGDDGVIAFPGLGQATAGTRLALQHALLGTFLQHGKSRGLDKNEKQLVLDPDAHAIPDSYRPMRWFKHQKAVTEVVEALRANKTERIPSVLFPGAVEKHPGSSWSRMEVTAEQYYSLLFAPVGCLPFTVRSVAMGATQRFALVIPEIRSLQTYGQLRMRAAKWSAGQLTVASPADAALQLAVLEQDSVGPIEAVGRRAYTVVAFGSQPWSTQLKTRTAVLDLDPPDEVTLSNYRLASEAIMEFQPRRLRRKNDAGTWVAPSAARGAIAEGLASGQEWWTTLIETYRRNSDFRTEISYPRERRGIAQMVEKAKWTRDDEKLFVEACHAAMHALYVSIGQRSTAAGTEFGQKAASEMTKIRSAFLRAKNADTFRQVLLDFWSRSSRSKVRSNPVLRQSGTDGEPSVWVRMLPLMDDSNWRKARDLALLALISYPAPEAPNDPPAES